MRLVARAIEPELRDILRVSRAAALIGPRQAGKSTLALQLTEQGVLSSYVTLDEEAMRKAALADPDGFVLALKRPVAIDEVQRAPELMLAIKQIVDRDQTPGQFLLTGSADLQTARVIADALPGRVEYVNLWPLSQAELAGVRESTIDRLLDGEPPLVSGAPRGRGASAEAVLAGGFPAALDRAPRQRARYFRSYVRTVIRRDLPDVGEVRIDSSRLEQLLRLITARTGGLVNYSALGRGLALNDKTIRAYIDLLAQLFMVLRLPAWSTSLGAGQRKTPKFHLTDSGMAAGLLSIDEARYAAPEHGVIAGMLFETFVTMELVKQATWSENPVECYHYRDAEGREVDLVIESAAGDVVGIEAKSAANVSAADLRALRYLREKLGPRFKAGVIVYCGERTLPFGDRIWAVPVSGLWSSAPAFAAVGRSGHRTTGRDMERLLGREWDGRARDR